RAAGHVERVCRRLGRRRGFLRRQRLQGIQKGRRRAKGKQHDQTPGLLTGPTRYSWVLFSKRRARGETVCEITAYCTSPTWFARQMLPPRQNFPLLLPLPRTHVRRDIRNAPEAAHGSRLTPPRHRALDPGLGFLEARRGSPRGRCCRRGLDPS